MSREKSERFELRLSRMNIKDLNGLPIRMALHLGPVDNYCRQALGH